MADSCTPSWRVLAATILTVIVGAATAADTSSVAPDWELDTSTGVVIRFHEDARGRPAVLLFWASWCPHCRALLPYIEALHDEFEPRGARFYALDIWEDGDAVRYFRERNYGMRLILAADLVAEQYGVTGTPGIVVTDGAQRVQDLPIKGLPPAAVAGAIRTILERELGARVESKP